MSRIEGLLKAYEEFVAQSWTQNLAGTERVWFAVYEPAQERRLQFRIPEFATATVKSGHGWVYLDLSDCFARSFRSQEMPEADLGHHAGVSVFEPALLRGGERLVMYRVNGGI